MRQQTLHGFDGHFVSEYCTSGLLIGRYALLGAYEQYRAATGLREKKAAYAAFLWAWCNGLEDFTRIVGAIWKRHQNGTIFFHGLNDEAPNFPRLLHKAQNGHELVELLGLKKGLEVCAARKLDFGSGLNILFFNFSLFRSDWEKYRPVLNALKHGRVILTREVPDLRSVPKRLTPRQFLIICEGKSYVMEPTDDHVHGRLRQAFSMVTHAADLLFLYLATYHPSSFLKTAEAWSKMSHPDFQTITGIDPYSLDPKAGF